MEIALEEDIVIVGAGIAGLTTSLALHRYSLYFPRFILFLYIEQLYFSFDNHILDVNFFLFLMMN